jgi:hypothetical protein
MRRFRAWRLRVLVTGVIGWVVGLGLVDEVVVGVSSRMSGWLSAPVRLHLYTLYT